MLSVRDTCRLDSRSVAAVSGGFPRSAWLSQASGRQSEAGQRAGVKAGHRADPIPATTRITHLRENRDAQDLELTPEELQTINGLAPEHAPAHGVGPLSGGVGR